jgi:hypothetical protein
MTVRQAIELLLAKYPNALTRYDCVQDDLSSWLKEDNLEARCTLKLDKDDNGAEIRVRSWVNDEEDGIIYVYW